MKTTIFISIAVLLCSCVTGGLVEPAGDKGGAAGTRGWIKVEVTGTNTSEPTHDDIEHLRIIVFKNVHAQAIVEQNLTRTFNAADHVAGLKMVLNVAHYSGETGKLVVAIANEPDHYSTPLTTLQTLDELKAMELDMQYFVHPNHLQMLSAATRMPMSGALWTPHIYDTQAEAEAETLKGRSLLQLKRAVARIDVLMTSDLGRALELREGSFVTLHNTFDRAPQIYDITHECQIGHIQTVGSGLFPKTWSIPKRDGWGNPIPPTGGTSDPGNVGSNTPVPIADTVLVCSFYTPERSCIADKLELEVGGIFAGDSGIKGGRLVLNSITPKGGTSQNFDVINRNNVYQVVVTVRATGITATVIDWNENEVETELR